MGDSSRSELKLNSPPDDGISAVKFGPTSSQFLLVASWDNTVRLYDVVANTQRLKYSHAAPVLDCCFHDAVHAWSGGLDHTLKVRDILQTGTVEVKAVCDNQSALCQQ